MPMRRSYAATSGTCPNCGLPAVDARCTCIWHEGIGWVPKPKVVMEEWAGHAVWWSLRYDFVDWLSENGIVESDDPWDVFKQYADWNREQERKRSVTKVTRKKLDRRFRRS